MKNILFMYFVILCSLTFFACSSSTSKDLVQNKIKEYIKLNMQKMNYKSIRFGELDSAFTSVKQAEQYKKFDQKRQVFETLGILSQQHPDFYSSEEIQINIDSNKYFKEICDSLELVFIPNFNGWKMQHLFQTRNDKNNLVVNNYIFYFDKELQKVTNAEQIYRNLPLKTYNQDPESYGIK